MKNENVDSALTLNSTEMCLNVCVWRTVAIVELFLMIRIIVNMFVENPSFELENSVNGMTSGFISPFLFIGATANSATEAFLFATLLAMVIYPLLGVMSTYIITLFYTYDSVYSKASTITTATPLPLPLHSHEVLNA